MSYVSQQFLLCDNASTANFKNWAQPISTAFSTAGWTQTSDTGQVNWSTVTVPASSAFVYEIWQPGDALQAGATAYYVKVKYGTSSGSPAGARLQIQIGTGTDGSGNLTGLTTTNVEPTNTTNNGNGSTVTYDCYLSGDTTRIGVMYWRGLNATGQTCFFAIERTLYTDGTNLSDGVILYWTGKTPATTAGQQIIVFGVAATTALNNVVPAIMDGNNASGAFNNNIPVSPAFPIYGKIGNPSTVVGFVHTQDVAEGCTFTTTLYGATRTYIATANLGWSTPANSKTVMRYD